MIYLDHNATTPVAPEVVAAMLPYLTTHWGNPSSVHRPGVEARTAIERSRRSIARALGAETPDDVIFTGSGSESDNIAIRGAALHARESGSGNHLVCSAAEHRAVLDTVRDLRQHGGFEVTILPVDEWGRVRPDDLRAALRADTVLVSLMMANNEVGSFNPVRELTRITHEYSPAVYHCDAIQGTGRLPLNVRGLGVDLLSITAHKVYGPKGIGVLYVRPGVALSPLATGGGQERGLRAGTENVAGAVGFAEAIALALRLGETSEHRVEALREELWEGIAQRFPRAVRNSPKEECVAGTLNFSLPGEDNQRLISELDAKGFAVSAGSACNATGTNHSHVLLAMGADEGRCAGGLRVSLGRSNTHDEIGQFLRAITDIAVM